MEYNRFLANVKRAPQTKRLTFIFKMLGYGRRSMRCASRAEVAQTNAEPKINQGDAPREDGCPEEKEEITS